MTFGFTTSLDFLSWIVSGLLAAKLTATLVLLNMDQALWLNSAKGLRLWWITKISPLLAMPGLIGLGALQRDPQLEIAGLLFSVFAYVAVFLKIREAFFSKGDKLVN